MRSEIEGTDVSAVLGGRLSLRQSLAGHRAGTDAVLLAAAAPRDLSGLVIDAGAGVGTAGLACALDRPGVELLLFDRDPHAVMLSRDNLAANGLAERGRAVEADLLSPKSRRAAGIADSSARLVLTNPPFLEPGQGRRSPDESRARAHVLEGPDGLAAWLRACAALVAPGGDLVVIHRADRLADLLAALEGRVGGIAICPVQARAGSDAIRVLLKGRKGSRGPLRLRPPLVLHEDNGRFTPHAEALHRGEATIDW